MKHKKIYAGGKYVPQRMCVSCRQIKPKADMLRVTLWENTVALDISGNRQGRGSYVCNNADCIEKAHKTRGFERGLKTKVPAEIYEECINFDK